MKHTNGGFNMNVFITKNAHSTTQCVEPFWILQD